MAAKVKCPCIICDLMSKGYDDMIIVSKGNVIVQMPCGCNSRKFPLMKEYENIEDYKNDVAEMEEFVDNHSEICWSKK